jgi:hypothetical protein
MSWPEDSHFEDGPPRRGAAVPSFAASAVEVAASGFRLAAPAVLEARLAACRACPDSTGALITCARCGCLMTVKARFEQVRCPRSARGESVEGW